VASTPTAWRCLGEIGAVQLARIDRARAKTRAHVWRQVVARHGGIPSARTCYGDLGKTIVIRLDASIVIAHSDKAGARGTFKGTYGHHPLLAVCDNTGELLVVMLREGNAGSNTGSDHVKVLDAAIAQVPAQYRRDLLVTIDGAGAGHQIVDHLSALNARRGHKVHYSIGFDLDERARQAISRLPAKVWEPALDADGKPRADAHVAELTGLLRESVDGDKLAGWPGDLRVIVRREPIPTGMQVSLFEQHDGYRYQVTATNTVDGQLQRLEARHRVHARVEDGVRTAKATGLRRLPSKSWGINEAWCQVVALATDLLAWLRHLTPGLRRVP
jgi:Transposase DDE domain group 1